MRTGPCRERGARPFSPFGAALLLTALVLLTWAARPAAALPAPAASFTISISDTPSPSDPFLLSFSVTVIPGAPTAFDWSFGDGHYWNGSGPTFAAPVHRYIDPGTFVVGVVVWEGNLSGVQTLSVTVAPAGLRAAIALDPSPAVSPFTALFTASITGGTGTYPTVRWTFGDGGSGSGLVIRYTYVRPGDYLAVLNVTDSAGTSVTSATWVNVSAGAGAEAGALGWSSLLVPAAGAVIGTVVGAAAFGLWLGRRRRAGPPDAGPEEEPEPAVIPSPLPAELSPAVTAPPSIEPAAPSIPSEASPSSVPAPSPTTAARAPAAAERLRLSQRIVLHLAGLGVLGADDVAPIGFSQLGMSDALDTRQNALTNVLRRLVAAGVLIEDVRHVRGQPRRLKVYRLTGRGEGLARDLRRHQHGDWTSPASTHDNVGPRT